MDATAAVQKSRSRIFLAAETEETQTASVNMQIPDYPNSGLQAQVTINGAHFVETVVVTVYIVHNRSGDLQVVLTSPSGTESILSQPHAEISEIVIENGPVYTVGKLLCYKHFSLHILIIYIL